MGNYFPFIAAADVIAEINWKLRVNLPPFRIFDWSRSLIRIFSCLRYFLIDFTNCIIIFISSGLVNLRIIRSCWIIYGNCWLIGRWFSLCVLLYLRIFLKKGNFIFWSRPEFRGHPSILYLWITRKAYQVVT